MLHGTAQASAITLVDILGFAKQVHYQTFAVFTPFLIAAALYIAITFVLVFIFRKCEKRWLAYLGPQR